MSPQEFIDKWKSVTQTERATAQSHFNDLCDLLGEPKPHDDDPTGDRYAFEKGASKTSGGDGWADVWRKGCFAWEYKGKHKALDKAMGQVKQYAAALENPPLLVACDINRIIVQTNWTNTVSVRYEVLLEDLIHPRKRELLKQVFNGDEKLKTGESRAEMTKKMAREFASLAQELEQAGHQPLVAAHFVIRLVFCMFAEDAGLLGDNLFSKLLSAARRKPAQFEPLAKQLFGAMSNGGLLGLDQVDWFNGGLFEDDFALPLTLPQIDRVRKAAELDWSAIDPSILGTLFERGLDPAKRSQLGAHYTDPENIMRIVEPVVLRPLRREWEAVRCEIEQAKGDKKKRERLEVFLARLRGVTILDPACGSGNFLYMALRSLKDLEHRVLLEAESLGLGRSYPELGPEVVKGIEISPYAAELARVSIWIGELQWQIEHGFNVDRNPVLKNLDSIENRDALLTEDGKEAEWPAAEFIIGNPPFLGDKKLRRNLGDSTVDKLRSAYADEVSGAADLCTYWFYKALKSILNGTAQSAGFIGTQGIRGGANRSVIQEIANKSRIFEAWSDLDWILDGASVHVSIVCFGNSNSNAQLDGEMVSEIDGSLVQSSTSLRNSRKINSKRAFVGVQKGGKFELAEVEAINLLSLPNASQKPNSDVLLPFFNGKDFSRGMPGRWLIDFFLRTFDESIAYEAPFAIIEERVYDDRQASSGRPSTNDRWWQHQWPRPDLRAASSEMDRTIACIQTAKYRQFRWIDKPILPSNSLIAFAFDDDYFFGVLHSRFHEVWALAQGTQLREKESGFRYTPTTCFETFPFPDPTDAQRAEIAEAARALNELRENWLNPAEWVNEETLIFPATVGGPWHRWIPGADALSQGSIAEARYVRLVPKPAAVGPLSVRTLTKLYNERPAWLRSAHQRLDEAVAAAYGFSADISESDLLAELLRMNLEMAEKSRSD